MGSFCGEEFDTESIILSTGRAPINEAGASKKFGSLPLSLHKVVPINCIPRKYYGEIASARLLELLVKLCKIMLARPGGSRKELEIFIDALCEHLAIFNVC